MASLPKVWNFSVFWAAVSIYVYVHAGICMLCHVLQVKVEGLGIKGYICDVASLCRWGYETKAQVSK